MNPALSRLPSPYRAAISSVQAALGTEVWLTGGWALSIVLDRKYVGDLDLITRKSAQEILSCLSSHFDTVFQSALGTARLHILDGNHLDIISTESFRGETTIQGALSRFTFSSNSLALSLSGEEVLYAASAEKDLALRNFRVNDQYCERHFHTIVSFKSMDALQYFFGLDPIEELRTAALLNARAQKKAKYLRLNGVQALRSAAIAASQSVPAGRRFWLARGIVRASLFEELTYWDDIDVMVEGTADELFDFIREHGMKYSVNYFGLPKLLLEDRQRMDLIPVSRAHTLEHVLNSFPHRLDRLAWEPETEKFVDPRGYMRDVESRALRLNLEEASDWSPSDLRYAALKSVYLLARHRLIPRPGILQLINSRLDYTWFDRKNVTRLAQELTAHGIARSEVKKYGRRGIADEGSAVELFCIYMEGRRE